jgi:hypothetical protein
MSNGPFGVPPPPGGYGPPPGYGAPPGYAQPGTALAPPGPPGANPYAAPGATTWEGPAGTVDGAGMKWLYLAGWGGYYLFAIGGGVMSYLVAAGGGASSDLAQVAGLLPLVGVVFLLLAPIGSMVWLYKSWSTVPQDMRYTDSGKWITPGTAVGYCFIPFYNLYWIFVANVGLCEAINRTMLARGGQPRAPKGLAIAACVAQLVPYCNLLVGPILWSVYMFMLDGARKEMVARPA